MNTHIIIPIKDFEGTNMIPAEKRDTAIVYLVRNSKQISLDEKDIEERALSVFPKKIYTFPIRVESKGKDYPCTVDENFEQREGYKKALKDLL